jgi:4-amino-4-deoxy-L-arabinose transferase-like glycosyltransferase
MMKLPQQPLIVAALAALLFIPFLGYVHLFDWDEINFAESAREMLVSGEYFRVQINFKPFWEKPPLFFWLQALSMKAFGINEFAARFPNAVCGIASLSLLFYIGKTKVNTRFAWLWVLFMVGSFTPALYFKSGIIDPWFNLFIFYAIWQLSQASHKQEANIRTKRFALIGISLGLAVLTKGPVALLVAALCVLIFWVRNRFVFFFNWYQVVLCVSIILGISSLWVVVEISHNGLGVIKDFIVYQIDLFKNPVAGHGQPWYYHPVVLLLGAFPASVFSFQGFVSKTTKPEEVVLKQWMSTLFWVVLILFSAVTTKIVHYSSLCWMPLTFMAAYGIEQLLQYEKRVPKLIVWMTALIGFVMSLLMAALPLIEHYKHKLIPYIKDDFAVAALSVDANWNGAEWIVGILLLFLLIRSIVLQLRGETMKGVVGLLVGIMIGLPVYLAWVVPKIEAYSQRPAIEFYESLQGKDCYVETLNMKSYAQYFYTQCKPHTHPQYNEVNWLLFGEIDKPAYFVSKITEEAEIKGYGAIEIGRKGGFIFWTREVPR